MRVRTEKRRQAIIKAAAEVFREQGLDRATMDAISKRVGGSKATLYGYFASKEALAIACLRELAAQEGANVEEFFKESDIRSALERFGLWRLRSTLSPGGLAARRLIWAEAGPGVIRKFFGDVDARTSTWGRLGAQLRRAMDAGMLRESDPWTAAHHFRGLLETDLSDRYFFGFPEADVNDAMIERATRDAVDAFMRAYGNE